MIIMAILGVWVGVALLFCLALARAASRPMPQQPDSIEIGEPSFGYEDAYEPTVARVKPAFGRRAIALS